MDYTKKDIVIHVDPRFAAYAMVMTTISFRSLVDFIETESGILFPPSEARIGSLTDWLHRW